MTRLPSGTYVCIKCNKEISLIAKTRHDRSCDGTFKKYTKNINHNLVCIFCNKEFGTNSGCGLHMRQCVENPDRIKRHIGTSWIKGKTKENYSQLNRTDATKLKLSILKTGKKHSEDTKKKLSIIRTAWMIANPRKGKRKQSWMELSFSEWLDYRNIEYETEVKNLIKIIM